MPHHSFAVGQMLEFDPGKFAAPPRAWPDQQECPVAQSKAKAENVVPTAAVGVEDEIAYLAKRHRVTPAIVREIMRRSGASERAAIEREIQKGKARR